MEENQKTGQVQNSSVSFGKISEHNNEDAGKLMEKLSRT